MTRDESEAVAEVLFYFDHPAGSWDATVLPEVREDYLRRAATVMLVLEKTRDG